MRMSQLLVRTLREIPSDAESVGHTLLVRAGFVRRLASGIYTLLPLGTRVLAKVEAIIREEQDAAGMQEIVMPVLSPYELWEESGRAAMFGQDALPAMTTEGRGGVFVLGPTHEEVATTTIAAEIDSYRQLPVTVYQIQSKFRDEARPRSGLLRLREFTMSDAYSFDANKEAMVASYDTAVAAYRRIFERLEIDVVPVEATSGAIGGDVNHEFMVPTTIGEDFFASCSSCGLAANIEAAVRRVNSPLADATTINAPSCSRISTPGTGSIEAVAALLSSRGVTTTSILKSIATLDADVTPTIIVVPGDREARLPHGWRLFEETDFASHLAIIRGFVGPVGLSGVRVVADESIRHAPHSFVVGANEADYHLIDVVVGRDFDPDEYGSFVVVDDGDSCPNCGAVMHLQRSVEAAHTFQLGLHYSSKIRNASFVAEDGSEQLFWMGCYGIGVSRLLAVLAEEKHDDQGLIWPASVAPYHAVLVAIGAGRNPLVVETADSAYVALRAAGVDVLYDDRDVSPGVKFADADLIGVPTRITVGGKGLDRGICEVRSRATGEMVEIPIEALLAGRLSI